MSIRILMARKLQKELVGRRVLIAICFVGILLLIGMSRYNIVTSAGMTAGIGASVANGLMALWGLRRPWCYHVDEQGIHLLMGNTEKPASRLILKWDRDKLVSFKLDRWQGLPAIVLVTASSKTIWLVYEPVEQNRVICRLLPILEKENLHRASVLNQG